MNVACKCSKCKIVRRSCCGCDKNCDIRDGNLWVRPFVVADIDDGLIYKNSFIYTEDTNQIHYVDEDGITTVVPDELDLNIPGGGFIAKLKIKV